MWRKATDVFNKLHSLTNYVKNSIEYEFSYIPLSSSRRDEDNVSDFDKFEVNMVKQNEALYLQNKVNCFETVKSIDAIFGPFDQNEILFYKKRLSNENGSPINIFQRQLIFNIFYKYFGDTNSIYAINIDDYIKLMIASKKILQNNGITVLSHIISGKVDKLVGRKTVNKKELMKMEASTYFEMIKDKYRQDKIIKQILSTVATIISSEFSVIDYSNPEIDGKHIETYPDIIIEEVLMYTLLI